MSITLRSLHRSPIDGLLIGSALVLALGACSGSGASDEPLTDETLEDDSPSTPVMPASPAAEETRPSTQSNTDEGRPDVTGLDPSTVPDDQEAEGDAEPDGDPDGEAVGMSTLQVGTPGVPTTDLCAAVADWDPEWVQFEEEVLLLVNEVRSQAADCGLAGQFEPAAPLEMDPILRCSARLHSVDMFERDYFEHNTPDGVTPVERMAAAGFEGARFGENIAQGQRTPEEVMFAWMDSDGHCENIMRAEYTLIGIGYSPGAPVRQGKSDFWTQNFGAPFSDRARR